MKAFSVIASLLLISQSVCAISFEEVYQSFEGEYELVEAIKETSPNMITRGSRCRDHLTIRMTENLLHLQSENFSGPGITLNWINFPSDEYETAFEKNSIVQNRFNERKILGLKKRNNMITDLSRSGDLVRLQYTASTETPFKTYTEAESICIYQSL